MSLQFRGVILLLLTFPILAVCRPIWAITCNEVFLRSGKHQIKVIKSDLNETDIALWHASGKGNREVGVVELLDINGRVIDTTDFVYQKSSGEIIERNIHVPLKEDFIQFIYRIKNVARTATAIRVTHVHPKTLTEEGVLHIGANWIFSLGDRQAAYGMKFLLEQFSLPHLSLEMHLVYQPPFAKYPRKKQYTISPEFTWMEGSYSLGKTNEQKVESMLNLKRSS